MSLLSFLSCAALHAKQLASLPPRCLQARGNCQMGGFTRLLHTGQPDDLMKVGRCQPGKQMGKTG